MLPAYLPTTHFPLAGYGVKYKYINGLRCKGNGDSAVAPENCICSILTNGGNGPGQRI